MVSCVTCIIQTEMGPPFHILYFPDSIVILSVSFDSVGVQIPEWNDYFMGELSIYNIYNPIRLNNYWSKANTIQIGCCAHWAPVAFVGSFTTCLCCCDVDIPIFTLYSAYTLFAKLYRMRIMYNVHCTYI